MQEFSVELSSKRTTLGNQLEAKLFKNGPLSLRYMHSYETRILFEDDTKLIVYVQYMQPFEAYATDVS